MTSPSLDPVTARKLAAESTRPAFDDLYMRGLNSLRWRATDPVELLAELSPDRLAEELWAGVHAAKESYGDVLSPKTQRLIDDTYARARGRLAHLEPLWTALVQHHQAQKEKQTPSSDDPAAKRGAGLHETLQVVKTTAEIGSLFLSGGWAAAVAIAVAGLQSIAESDTASDAEAADAKIEQAWQAFRSSTSHWYHAVERDLDLVVLPHVRRELTAYRRGPIVNGMRVALPILALGVVVALVAWIVTRPKPASSEATAASVASASSVVRVSPLADLAGTWTSDSGAVYESAVAGDALVFRLVDPKALTKQGYQVGETHFTLRGHPDLGFDLEAKVHPSLPAWLTYADGGPAQCNELWSEVKGQKLRARADASRLIVELVKIDLLPTEAVAPSGRVERCKQLDASRASKTQVVLTRAP